MQIKKSVFAASLVACSLVFGAIGVGASTGIEQIKAALNHNIKFKLDGASWTPKDSKGKALSALVYNGSNYVPLRAVAEALGADVGYDSKTQIVTINSADNSGVPYDDVKENTSSNTDETKAPSDNGLIYLSGTTATMTTKMKEQAVTVIKLYADALATGSMAKFNAYYDSYVSDKRANSPISLGHDYYKEKFKKDVEATIKGNDASDIADYAKTLKNVTLADIEVSYVGEKSEYSQSFQYSYYPKGWSAFSGVFVYFSFNAIEYDSDTFVLADVHIG
ncbi:stalk domain-containing protein [Cohnella faecalis]|uniref:Copper amine oxidase N-terminal domain-containing protein n=1 Tax=Cohnella faecalis TaxID=2315694 RepID=A0A398CFH3_9BACL|nr:stalk domain-containing protein [Cohnella faecalis]RIE01473.1 copper amine oxidase N-terminal domain-containing protein [Cohnella faecalis]